MTDQADSPRRQSLVGVGTGMGGRQQNVYLSGDGVYWCECPGWISCARLPRTCSHISCLVDEGLAPAHLAQSEEDFAAEVRSYRGAWPTAEAVAAALREARGAGRRRWETPTVMGLATAASAAREVATRRHDFHFLVDVYAACRARGVACAMGPQAPADLDTWVEARRAKGLIGWVCYTREAWSVRGNALRLDYGAGAGGDLSAVEQVVLGALRSRGVALRASGDGFVYISGELGPAEGVGD